MGTASGPDWQIEDVGGVSVRSLPPGPDGGGIVVVLPDVVWPDAADLVVLHDLMQERKLGAVVPWARSWWIDRSDPVLAPPRSPLSFAANELGPWIAARWPATTRLAALGVGFGGQGALQLGYRFPNQFPIVAAVSPAIDFHGLYDSSPLLREWFDSREAARQETATLRLHPLNWPGHQWFACPRGDWRFDGCERLASKLTSIGIPFTADLQTAAGPGYQEFQLRQAVEFIAARQNEPPARPGIRVGQR